MSQEGGSVVVVLTTGPDRETLMEIGRKVVKDRLAACVNILDGMNSIYWWEGEIQDDRETVLIAKTREVLLPALIERVKALHSYSCPCVVALPILAGNPEYLTWLREEARPA